MKTKTKTLISAVAIAVLCCTLLGWLSSGFTDFKVHEWFKKERHPENLILIDDVTLTTGRHESGISIEVDDNGVVTLNGTSAADVSLVYAPVSLNPGKYVLTGAENGSRSTYELSVIVGADTVRGDWPGTFEVTTAGPYTIKINVKADTKLNNVKIYPVVNTGSTPVEFYK